MPVLPLFTSVLALVLAAAPALPGNGVRFAEDVGWKVGVAQRDITPQDNMWMGGYGARSTTSTGMLQPLWAKALALEDSHGERAVVVTSELLGIPREVSNRIRDRIEQELGLPRARVMLTTSHTHTGPVLENALYDIYPLDETQRSRIERYTQRLEGLIVEMVRDAVDGLAPARLSAGHSVVRFAVNRRNNTPSEVRSLSELNGPSDHDVPVIAAHAPEGNLKAVLFGYACHATTLPPGVLEWSGDYPGFAQNVLEERYDDAMALFFAGAGADQDPIPRGSVALARQYGQELAAAVDRALEDTMTPLSADLETAYDEIPLQFSDPPSRETLTAAVAQESSSHQRWAARMLTALDRGEEPRSSYPYPIQVWKVGDQVIVALGGEVVVDYAFSIKRILGQDTHVVAYANDVMGYIPSTRILREGGYEGERAQRVYGLPATWAPDTETRILSAVLRLAEQAGIDLPETHLD